MLCAKVRDKADRMLTPKASKAVLQRSGVTRTGFEGWKVLQKSGCHFQRETKTSGKVKSYEKNVGLLGKPI